MIGVGGDVFGLFSTDKKKSAMESDMPVLDSEWIDSRYISPDSALPSNLVDLRYASRSYLKFVDSSMGGHTIINPRPQFTRYCDIKGPNIDKFKKEVTLSGDVNIGMGEYYSRSIDDNQQVIHMEFGFKRFNSLTDIFFRSIDYSDTVLANTGRLPIAYMAGEAVGALVMLAAFPVITLTIYAIKTLVDLTTEYQNYAYYYMEPNMSMFWGTVNTLMTELVVEMGIKIPTYMPKGESGDPNISTVGVPIKLRQSELDEIKKYMPDLINDNNFIDVFAIVTRTQAKANQLRVMEYEALKEDVAVKASDIFPSRAKKMDLLATLDYYTTFSRYLNDTVPNMKKDKRGDDTSSSNDVYGPPPPPGVGGDKYTKDGYGHYHQKVDIEKKSRTARFIETLDSSVRHGGSFVSMAVEYTGSTTESFSNSVGEIGTGNAMRALATKGRNMTFDFAGGNLSMGADQVIKGLTDVAAGALDSVTFGASNIIATLTGGAYMSVPKKWEDSSMSFPSITYKMDLLAPYGHVISRIQNEMLPLTVILSGILALSAGKSAYTSPYLCKLFCKGVQKIDNGMITSATIERGTANLAFDQDRVPRGLTVSFNVVDFSTLITARVNSSIFDDVFNLGIEDDTPLGRYISLLGGRDYLSSKYASQRAKIRLSKAMMNFDKFASPAGWAMRLSGFVENTLGALVSERTVSGTYMN